MSRLVFYVSGHGFGHAVRAAEVLRAVRRLDLDLPLEVRTEAPEWMFPLDARVLRRRLDVGVVQPDSFRVEPSETLARYAALVEEEADLIVAEAAELRREAVGLVVADIPAVAFAIAARAGVPGVGVANFCWDWIYEPYVGEMPEQASLLKHLRGQYGRADLLLRLPLHGDMSCFRRIVDIPLIARRGSADRAATRRRLGLPIEAPLVLLSFGGFDFAGPDPGRLAEIDGYAFVATAPRGEPARAGNLFVLPRHGYAYVDLLAACDAVVTKPGYGIVADCLANRVPVLYATRGRFREEPILDDALERLGRAVRLPRSALDRGDLRPYLDRLLALDHPWAELRLDGADVAARHLLAMANR
jgi:hypothetical protein